MTLRFKTKIFSPCVISMHSFDMVLETWIEPRFNSTRFLAANCEKGEWTTEVTDWPQVFPPSGQFRICGHLDPLGLNIRRCTISSVFRSLRFLDMCFIPPPPVGKAYQSSSVKNLFWKIAMWKVWEKNVVFFLRNNWSSIRPPILRF